MPREAVQTLSFRGRRSRNKVSVGEPAEGSLPVFPPAPVRTVLFHCPLGARGWRSPLCSSARGRVGRRFRAPIPFAVAFALLCACAPVGGRTTTLCCTSVSPWVAESSLSLPGGASLSALACERELWWCVSLVVSVGSPRVSSSVPLLSPRSGLPLSTPTTHTTPADGYLGSRNDEERSEMRYVVRIAEFSESSNL